MALVVKDRVQETTTTTGTGTITLGGAVLGFQSFATIGDGNATYYTINDTITGDWEVGIGTYTASGTTLSRDTVLSSSSGGTLVSFAAGSKNVFVTYPSSRSVYLSAAGLAVDVLDIGTLGTSTANISTANITAGTVSTTPVNNTDIVNKQYADAIASGIHFHEAVDLATTTALPANTYNNGTSGVGATLTANANGALSVDSTLTVVGYRVLVKNEATQANNGVYTVTQVGRTGGPGPAEPYILTRATDFDTVGTGVNQIDEGDFFLVTSGTVNLNTAWVQQTAPPITIGTTAIVFQQFAAPITYTAGTGLSESPTYTFNIANTGVSASTYGSASQVPVFAVNAQGQITSVTNTAIAIAAGAVSGLAASATTDTTNATNITSGTLPTGRLSGSYTGITGVGTLTAGTWNGSVIGPVYGGTGFGTYAVGDLLYADTTTSLAKLADVAVGNALISGGVGSAPAWGKIGLATHVSGTLPIANGGTNTSATATNGGVTYGTGTAYAFTAAGISGQILQSNGAAAPTWVNLSTLGVSSFSAGTTGFTPSTATTGAVTLAGTLNVANGGTGVTTSTGTGSVVLSTSPSLVTPILGTPQSGNFSTGTFTWPTFNQNTTGNAATATSAVTLYGSTTLYISPTNANTFNSGFGSAADGSDIWINYRGYNDSFSYFRDFRVGNGKGTQIALFTGSSGNLTLAGTGSSASDWRAPIFYDSNDTTYYVDPNSRSVLSSLNVGSATTIGTGKLSVFAGGAGAVGWATGFNLGDASNYTTWIQDAGVSRFRNTGTGGMDWYNSAGGTQIMSLSDAGHLIAPAGSMRAPIFYDNNNTGYYVDPASTSNINQLNMNGPIVRTVSGQGYLNGNYSSSETVTTSGAIYSIGGVYVPGTTTLSNMYGVGYAYTGAGRAVGNSAGTPSDIWGLYGAAAGVANWFLDATNGRGYFNSQVNATIFYDANNTGYYVDPSSTSNLAGWTSNMYGRLGLNQWFYNRANNTADAAYYVGSQGWSNTVTWNAAFVQFGSCFMDIWGTSTDHPQGAGYVHAQGLQALHYRDGGSVSYGWQMVGAADASNRWWLRGKWGTTYRSWYEIVTYGNNTGGGAIYPSIVYDSDNTGYYCDPNGTSVLNGAIFNGSTSFVYGGVAAYMYGNGATAGSAGIGLNVYSTGGNGAIMAFHRGGAYAVNMGLDSDNVLRIGGWSAAANRWQLDMSGNNTIAGDFYAVGNMKIGKGNNAVSTNTAVGVSALASVNSNYHTAVGYNALQGMTTYTNPVFPIAGGSTAVGYGALQSNVGNATLGAGNTAIGSGAMYNSTGAYFCTTVGAYSGYNLTNASGVTIVGHRAGQYLQNNNNCVIIGYNTAPNLNSANGAGNSTIIIGNNAGAYYFGSNNTIIGNNAGQNMASSDAFASTNSNVIVGANVLATQSYDTLQCTFVGYAAMNTWDGQIINSSSLGYLTNVTGNNQVQLGNSSTTTYVYGTVQNRSDARDKADIRDTQLGLGFIEALRPVDFRWDYRDSYVDLIESEDEEGNDTSTRVEHPKDGSRKRSRYHHGLIAQEVKEVLDAKGIDFGGYQDHSVAGGKDVLTIGYDELVGPLIKAVQELSTQVKALSLELADLKAKS